MVLCHAAFYRFAYNKDSLLDLCCGRGGDIHKWNDVGVSSVQGTVCTQIHVCMGLKYPQVPQAPNTMHNAQRACFWDPDHALPPASTSPL